MADLEHGEYACRPTAYNPSGVQMPMFRDAMKEHEPNIRRAVKDLLDKGFPREAVVFALTELVSMEASGQMVRRALERRKAEREARDAMAVADHTARRSVERLDREKADE
ncbi:hypothetical protein RPALISO_198 [Ruegeria phage RpAliso]|nr:hypothetical protein RPALISO_198 [Ruegeria phage RpAliso]